MSETVLKKLWAGAARKRAAVRRRIGAATHLVTSPNMTPARMVSYVLSRYSYRTRRARNLSGPSVLFIEATSVCNLHCVICPTGVGTLGRPKGRMSLDQFKSLVDQSNRSLRRVVFAGYGEPFVNPAVYDMITYARSRRVFTELYSNALLLDDEDLVRVVDCGLDLLVVAIDLAPEGKNWRYVKRTGRDIDKVTDRLRRLSELKRERGSALPRVRISYPVTKDNEAYLEEARQLALDVGAEEFLPKSVNAVVAGKDPKEMMEKYVSEAYSRYGRPKEGPGHCRWPYNGALVYANGDVSPCCHLARGEHNLGNVFADGIEGVWNGKKYVQFRLKLMTEPHTVDHCAHCVERFSGI